MAGRSLIQSPANYPFKVLALFQTVVIGDFCSGASGSDKLRPAAILYHNSVGEETKVTVGAFEGVLRTAALGLE